MIKIEGGYLIGGYQFYTTETSKIREICENVIKLIDDNTKPFALDQELRNLKDEVAQFRLLSRELSQEELKDQAKNHSQAPDT